MINIYPAKAIHLQNGAGWLVLHFVHQISQFLHPLCHHPKLQQQAVESWLTILVAALLHAAGGLPDRHCMHSPMRPSTFSSCASVTNHNPTEGADTRMMLPVTLLCPGFAQQYASGCKQFICMCNSKTCRMILKALISSRYSVHTTPSSMHSATANTRVNTFVPNMYCGSGTTALPSAC